MLQNFLSRIYESFLSQYNAHSKEKKGEIIPHLYHIAKQSSKIEAIEIQKFWGTVFFYTNEGIMITDKDNKIVQVNRSFEQITGYNAKEALGKTPSILSSGKHEHKFYLNMWDHILKEGLWQGEIYNRRKNGEIFPEWLTIIALKDDNEILTHYIAIFSDISSFKEKEKEINYLSFHDRLTGLPNRTMFENRLQQAIFQARRNNSKVAVFFLNLDKFRNINNSLGHSKGDLLLIETANRLGLIVPKEGTLARFNSDEFVFIINIQSKEEASSFAEKMIQSILPGYILDEEPISIRPSIGISIYPDDAFHSEYLIKYADAAMYSLKSIPGKYYQFYIQEINELLQSRIKLEKYMIDAIAKNEFHLMFQPKYNLRSGAVVGAEILLRWTNTELGQISPADFIPIAENTGLILQIGEWVINTSMKQIGSWLEKDRKVLRYNFSINVSPRQLEEPRFIEALEEQLNQNKISPQMIALEITETAVMQNLNYSNEILTRLRKLDIKICVDDFGTGYSSLNYLKKLPISSLKIDKSFIQDIPADNNSTSITEAIIQMAHNLELITVAEGVETAEQAEFLLEADCDMVQGFYYEKPLFPNEFMLLLKESGALV